MIKTSPILVAQKRQFGFETIEQFTAGIVLTGNEIKSIRLKNVSIREAYALVRDNELYIFNMYIAPYCNANASTTGRLSATQKRKLLVKKSEIRKLVKSLREKSVVIIPTQLFINSFGWAKLELRLAKKLRKYQLKSKLKEKDLERQIDRAKF